MAVKNSPKKDPSWSVISVFMLPKGVSHKEVVVSKRVEG